MRVAVRVAVPGAAAWGPAEGAHCLRELLKHLLYLRGQVRLASPGVGMDSGGGAGLSRRSAGCCGW